jgi:hypothetical protein
LLRWRRSFILVGLMTNTTLAGSVASRAGRDAVATARVALGRSGLTVPRLAMGTGSNGWARASDQTRLGEREFVKLMRHGAERGAEFIDAADLYGSHTRTSSRRCASSIVTTSPCSPRSGFPTRRT